MTEQTLPQLIAEVSATLSRIEKRGTAPTAMGGFSFVREQDVIEALKPELDSRGIVLRPDVELLRLDTFARSGKDMPNTVATISLALYAVRGTEEYLIARTVGQGADTQDKAVGKAVTAAKKQGILVAFAIPTGDDPDASAIPERTRRTAPGQGVGPSRTAGGTSPAEPVPVPADPFHTAANRANWAASFGWTVEAIEQAALDATNTPLGELDHDGWKLFAAAVVKGGPGLPPDKQPASDERAGPLAATPPATTPAPVDQGAGEEPVDSPSTEGTPPAPVVPPKPGTAEYKALPDGGARADARAYWQAPLEVTA